jgi:hypothetical protein
MSALTETSLTSMKAAFPTAPAPILPYDAHVPLFVDPEGTCLSYNKHAVPCGIT